MNVDKYNIKEKGFIDIKIDNTLNINDEIDKLRKRFKNLYSLIEKLNIGGVFDVKLDEV